MPEKLYWVERARGMLDLIEGALSPQQMDTYARTAQAMATLAIAEELHIANIISMKRNTKDESIKDQEWPADVFLIDRDGPLRNVDDDE